MEPFPTRSLQNKKAEACVVLPRGGVAHVRVP